MIDALAITGDVLAFTAERSGLSSAAMSTDGWPILVALLVACGPAIPPLPSRGGPAWLEVQSEHFVLWTDATAPRGHELVHELEFRHQLLVTAMSHARSKTRSFVIALNSAREIGEYLPRNMIAAAWDARNPSHQPGILVAASAQDNEHVLSHELTHVISYGFIKNAPHWLSEGIATYFEMVDVDVGERSVEIGRPPANRAAALRDLGLLSTARLFACTEPPCMDAQFYATSWALFSFLINQRYDQLGRYLQRLNELSRNQQANAWLESFPDLPPDRLDEELSEWLISGKLRLPRIEIAVHKVPVRDRPLGDADVLTARSLLALRFKAVEPARVAAENALAIDRSNLLARLINTELTREIAPDDARATAAAHPDDWRAWRLVEHAGTDRTEVETARRRVCTLTGDQAPECDLRAEP